MRINGIVRVIDRKQCLRCGYPVQVEAYTIDQAKDMIKEYKECKNRLNSIDLCNNTIWGTSKFNVIVQKK